MVWKRVYPLPIFVWNRVWSSREPRSVWKYLSFQFQMSEKEREIREFERDLNNFFVCAQKSKYWQQLCLKTRSKNQSCPILPHCYGPLRAVNRPYVLHKPSLLLTVQGGHNALRFVRSVRSEDIRSVHLIITSGHNALRFVRSVRSARQERRTPTVIFLVL